MKLTRLLLLSKSNSIHKSNLLLTGPSYDLFCPSHILMIDLLSGLISNLGCFRDDLHNVETHALFVYREGNLLWCCPCQIRLRTLESKWCCIDVIRLSHLVPYALNQWNHMSFHLCRWSSINWIDTLAS